MSLELDPELTVLLYGPTGTGKSTLAAELAKALFKQGKKRSAVFLADEGSRMPYARLEKLGVVETIKPHGNPWIWVNHSLQGEVWDGKKWVSILDRMKDCGLVIHEGLTSYAEMLMQEMARMSAENINVGGEGVATVGVEKEKDEKNVLKAWKFAVKGEGEVLKVGGNSMAHYGIAQVQTREGLLRGRPKVPHVYTAMLRRGAEEGTKAPVSGPQLVGGALTGSLPRWFDYTFRVDVEDNGQHVLYLTPKVDPALGGKTMMLVNPRLPMEGGKVQIPMSLKPASLVGALLKLQEREQAALEELKGELGL